MYVYICIYIRMYILCCTNGKTHQRYGNATKREALLAGSTTRFTALQDPQLVILVQERHVADALGRQACTVVVVYESRCADWPRLRSRSRLEVYLCHAHDYCHEFGQEGGHAEQCN